MLKNVIKMTATGNSKNENNVIKIQIIYDYLYKETQLRGKPTCEVVAVPRVLY